MSGFSYFASSKIRKKCVYMSKSIFGKHIVTEKRGDEKWEEEERYGVCVLGEKQACTGGSEITARKIFLPEFSTELYINIERTYWLEPDIYLAFLPIAYHYGEKGLQSLS